MGEGTRGLQLGLEPGKGEICTVPMFQQSHASAATEYLQLGNAKGGHRATVAPSLSWGGNAEAFMDKPWSSSSGSSNGSMSACVQKCRLYTFGSSGNGSGLCKPNQPSRGVQAPTRPSSLILPAVFYTMNSINVTLLRSGKTECMTPAELNLAILDHGRLKD